MTKTARTTAKHNVESAVAQSETAVMAKRNISEWIQGRDVRSDHQPSFRLSTFCLATWWLAGLCKQHVLDRA